MKSTGNPNFANTILPNLPLGKKVMKCLRKSWDDQLLTKLILPDEEWATKIFAPQLISEKPNFVNVNPGAAGLTEVRMIMTGSIHTIGLNVNFVLGETLKDKRRALFAQTSTSLANSIGQNGGLSVGMEKDSTIIIPSGMLMMTAAGEEGVTYLRWSVSGDQQDTCRVRLVLNNLLASFPELRAGNPHFNQFQAWLADNTA